MPIPRNLEKAVPKLLIRLNEAKTLLKAKKINENEEISISKQIDEIESQLNNMKDLFPRVKPWEEDLLHYFTVSEHQLDSFVSDAEVMHSVDSDAEVKIKEMLLDIGNDMVAIGNSVSPIERMPDITATDAKESSRRGSQLEDDDKHRAGGESLHKWLDSLKKKKEEFVDKVMKILQVSYENLGPLHLRLCLLYFSVFPQNAVIRKRLLIYWWIGEDLITNTKDKTAEEVGEDIVEKFLALDFIKSYSYDDKPNQIVSKYCRMNPWIRYMMISLVKNANFFALDSSGTPSSEINGCRRVLLATDQNVEGKNGLKHEDLWTVFNLSERYLSFQNDLLNKLRMVKVLQLGRWQDSARHHIEVQNEGFLKGLGAQKHLKYLSLRGISRITALPPSIADLISLEILDLKACHNLEALPSEISSLKKLTHLDVSECYLLESMPKGLEKLSTLQVLKGFVMGNPSKRASCRLGQLTKLENLKRLSIRIGNEAQFQDSEFDLKKLKLLRCLKILWGTGKSQDLKQMESFSFPPNLQKLDLEGIPYETPEWLKPGKLKNLKKLHIKGGQFRSFVHKGPEKWVKVEILRLKYLKIKGLSKLLEQFPNLRNPNTTECQEIEEGKFAKKEEDNASELPGKVRSAVISEIEEVGDDEDTA
ncbi:Disease resistance RPP13-like protein 4 [Quillaja saponaria]|uniref:Disease resistance RPP13-like protein 4 n=1 Tax=Quillaja saponaria TaxID=32244 RepID=A0AAD7QB51_QUISA|nr:Disease resistance RPP13-like protein 4 [Quillaja saponaria]